MYKPMHKQLMNMLIVNQSSIDTFAAIMIMFSAVFQNNAIGQKVGNLQDEALCKLWFSQMWMWSGLLSSTYGIVAVTFERYLAVVHPIWHKAKFTRKKALLLIISVWIIGPCYYSAYAIITSGITDEGICSVYSHYSNVSDRHISAAIQVLTNYIFPLFILAYFYVEMIIALRRVVPIVPQGVNVTNQKKIPEKEVMRAMNKADSVVQKNIAKEILHKQRLMPLETGGHTEVQEEMPEDKRKFTELSHSEQPSASKIFVVQVDPVEIPNVKILDSRIECDRNVVNVGEKTGMSPMSCTPSQTITPILLKIEPKKTGNIEIVKNIKNSAVEAKSIQAPKESASTARAKRNVIKTLALVSCGFILCWSGTEVSFYLNDLGLIQLDWSGAFYNFTNVMVFISCCINPVVYCIQYNQFQKGVKYVISHNRIFTYFFGEGNIDQPFGTGNTSASTINTSMNKSH